jgi:uroporphyrinogen decarboxylase
MMKKNTLFLRTINRDLVERPPVWLMRQAGRILPEYKAIRAKLTGFKELVKSPELAAEVTLQPVDLLKVDAAILFSDILVIPEAMGLDYEMIEARGPFFPKTIQSKKDINQLLSGEAAAERLDYVYNTISEINKYIPENIPLIGFAGAPWTILAYMIEGKGSKTFSVAKKFLYAEPEWSHYLLEKITDSTIHYLRNQVKAGVQTLQLFDSWAGLLSMEQFNTFSLPYMQRIKEAIPEVPLTIFAKGAMLQLQDLASIKPAVIGIDWNISPIKVREWLGADTVLQGNMDPCLLYATPQHVFDETVNMCREFGRNHIANLGHGVYPDTPLEGVKAFIAAVKSTSYVE